MLKIKAVLSCDVIKISFADLLKLNSSLILISLRTDRTPFISHVDTYKKKIYVYGIALTSEEKDLVISEATEILDVENVVASILLVEDLRIQKE